MYDACTSATHDARPLNHHQHINRSNRTNVPPHSKSEQQQTNKPKKRPHRRRKTWCHIDHLLECQKFAARNAVEKSKKKLSQEVKRANSNRTKRETIWKSRTKKKKQQNKKTKKKTAKQTKFSQIKTRLITETANERMYTLLHNHVSA